MNLRIIATLSCAVAAMFVSSCSTNGAVTGMGKSSSDALVLARVGETAQGFVQPLAPSRSAAPSSKLPKLGRDKHKMPFYHPAQRTRVVRTTAYTHSERDHLAYGPRNAVGTALKYTSSVRSAAADWSVYPLGTTFRIKGQPYLYVVDDYGSALVGTGTIDIYQPNKKLMKEWGRRYVELTYRPLGEIPPTVWRCSAAVAATGTAAPCMRPCSTAFPRGFMPRPTDPCFSIPAPPSLHGGAFLFSAVRAEW